MSLSSSVVSDRSVDGVAVTLPSLSDLLMFIGTVEVSVCFSHNIVWFLKQNIGTISMS
jgi:hypothetical protein